MQYGVLQVWRDLKQWGEHEAALMKAGMRQREPGFRFRELVIEQEIEIEGAGAVFYGKRAVTAEALFHFEQCMQQIPGWECSTKRERSVEERGLRDAADRVGLVERRGCRDLSQGGEALRRGL